MKMEMEKTGIHCTPMEKMLRGDESPDFKTGFQLGYEREAVGEGSHPWGSGSDMSMGYLPEATVEQDGQRRSQMISWGRASELAEKVLYGEATVTMSDFRQGQLYACVMRSLDCLARGEQQASFSPYFQQEIAAALYLLDRVDDQHSREAIRKAVEQGVQKSGVRGLEEVFDQELQKYGGKKKMRKEQTVRLQTDFGRELIDSYAGMVVSAVESQYQSIKALDLYATLEDGLARELLGRQPFEIGQSTLQTLRDSEQVVGRDYVDVETYFKRGAHEWESPSGVHLAKGVQRFYIEGTGKPLVPPETREEAAKLLGRIQDFSETHRDEMFIRGLYIFGTDRLIPLARKVADLFQDYKLGHLDRLPVGLI